jgi:hypothetical protein
MRLEKKKAFPKILDFRSVAQFVSVNDRYIDILGNGMSMLGFSLGFSLGFHKREIVSHRKK